MNTRLFVIAFLSLIFLRPANTAALTMGQFSSICESASGECSDHPILQAYVGGALDLLVTLDEETRYLNKLYCKKSKELFEVPTIIRFMQMHRKEHTSRNAMLLVIRYFEERGGC